jgi:hypothetical protein
MERECGVDGAAGEVAPGPEPAGEAETLCVLPDARGALLSVSEYANCSDGFGDVPVFDFVVCDGVGADWKCGVGADAE